MEENEDQSIQFEEAGILVVDDISLNRRLLKEILRNLGLRMIEAESGEEAILIAKETMPDVVLMDIKMFGMSGSDAAKELKKGGTTAKIPIIALTASSDFDDPKEIINAGFDGYLTKPVFIGKLVKELSRFLKVKKV